MKEKFSGDLAEALKNIGFIPKEDNEISLIASLQAQDRRKCPAKLKNETDLASLSLEENGADLVNECYLSNLPLVENTQVSRFFKAVFFMQPGPLEKTAMALNPNAPPFISTTAFYSK